MTELALGTVVAERVLLLDSKPTVVARIGLPYTPENYPDESWCPYQIVGLGTGCVRRTIGIDSVQALSLAFQMVGTDLYHSEEYRSGRLAAFPGEEGRDLGFPASSGKEDLLPEGD